MTTCACWQHVLVIENVRVEIISDIVGTIPCYRILVRFINMAIDTCIAKIFTLFKLKNVVFPIYFCILKFLVTEVDNVL